MAAGIIAHVQKIASNVKRTPVPSHVHARKAALAKAKIAPTLTNAPMIRTTVLPHPLVQTNSPDFSARAKADMNAFPKTRRVVTIRHIVSEAVAASRMLTNALQTHTTARLIAVGTM